MSSDRDTSSTLTAHRGRVYTPLRDMEWADITDGVLVVDQSGKIRGIGCSEDLIPQLPNARVIEHEMGLIIPGLVDCHQHLTHFEWSRLIRDLFQWLKEIYALELRFTCSRYAAGVAERFFRSLIRSGTTTCCVHGPYFAAATESAFQAARDVGIRVIMGMNSGDTDLPDGLRRDADQAISDARSLYASWDGKANGLLSYCFTVRPAYCASDQLLRETAKAARELGARIQCHLGEDIDGRRAILRRFPSDASEVAVYGRRGLLGPTTIMAHSLQLNRSEYFELGRYGVSVAHCPRANLLAGGRQLDTQTVRDGGVVMGLGTDLGGGKNLSMFRTMEDALKVSTTASIHDVFRWGTIEGARALGIGRITGSLEPGKSADFVVVRDGVGSRCRAMVDEGIDDVLTRLVFCSDDRWVRKCYVAGKRVWALNPE